MDIKNSNDFRETFSVCYVILFLRFVALFCKMIATCIKHTLGLNELLLNWTINFPKKNKQKIAPAEKLLFWLYKNRITINMKRAFAWISLHMNTVYFGSYLYFFLLLSFKNFILHTLFRYMVIVLFMRNLCIARVKRCSFLFSQSNACINHNDSTFTVDTVIF